MIKVLFLNHKEEKCGVHQFGANVAKALEKYGERHIWSYQKVDSWQEYWNAFNFFNPDVVIYNYYPSTMPWLTNEIAHQTPAERIAIVHETSQWPTYREKFHHVICPDPTLQVDDPFVFTTGRCIPEYSNPPPPDKLTIGTFGFGFGNKGNYRLVEMVNDQFEEAKIRLHMSYAAFGDADGSQARQWAEECRQRVTKPGVELEIVHDFLPTTKDVLDFLSGHSLNAFIYDQMHGRGISSTIDYALAVNRPIAISSSDMFRHIYDAPIRIEEHSFADILARGVAPLSKFKEDWTPRNLARDYEEIIDRVSYST